MKKIILFLFTAFISTLLIAQTTITNPGLETWTGSGQTIEPTQWNSTKSAGGSFGGFAPQTCFQEATNPHGGTYCARLETKSALGTTVNGALTSGRIMAPSTNAAEGFIQTVTNDANFRMSFVGRPDSFVFWYRYTPVGADFPSVEARTHINGCQTPEIPVNNNHPLDTPNIVARAMWQGANATVGTWTRVSVPFVYRNGTTPQYILITATSSAGTASAQVDSKIWLDDFDVIYNPTLAIGTVSPLAYYVSATTGAAVNVPYTITGTYNAGNTFTAQLSDANGSFASPVSIGSVTSTTAGTINALIPAGTVTGTGYRIRVVSSNPSITSTDNGSNISITLVSNSIFAGTTQVIPTNTNGTVLGVNETPVANSREWKYSTTSGNGYVSFGTAQTGLFYTPNFPTTGTYYVVCVSTFGSFSTISNEVRVDVVGNSIAPTSSQSLLVGVDGTPLTVTETPAGMWREWKYTTTPGSNYQSFSPAVTGAFSYTPNFASAGTYYVVCYSEISGVFVYSNEVQINVGNATLNTGAISGSPFLFSPSAPAASVSVPFTTSGTFNNGNVFTAQLSDAAGSFTSAVDIGTLTSTTSGTVSASIPSNTAAGTQYRIRVISNNPAIVGSDNGTDLVVDQFNNSIAPSATQTIQHGTDGSAITVTASQPATHEWKFTTTSGSGYLPFSPAETGSSYTPNFALPGTYFVVCISVNTHTDEVTSNEVQIDVTNGNTITTSTVNGSPFAVSPNLSASVNVDFTSDVIFNAGNVFKAQLSDFAGSFANPVEIGTLTSSTIGTIAAQIPGNSGASSNYRIRVVSTDPAVIGSDNGTDLEVIPFGISIAPTDTQHIAPGTDGSPITVTTTQTASYSWQFSEVPGTLYSPFNPIQTSSTGIPKFALAGVYYVVCKATNSANDILTSDEVVVIVSTTIGIHETGNNYAQAYWRGNDFVVNLSAATQNIPTLELVNAVGQTVLKEKLSVGANAFTTSLPQGIYVFRIVDGSQAITGRTSKK